LVGSRVANDAVEVPPNGHLVQPAIAVTESKTVGDECLPAAGVDDNRGPELAFRRSVFRRPDPHDSIAGLDESHDGAAFVDGGTHLSRVLEENLIKRRSQDLKGVRLPE